jgi:hypothetical protein
MSEPMRVRVSITVTLADPEEWTRAFGVSGRAARAFDRFGFALLLELGLALILFGA